MPKRDKAPIGAPCWIELFSSDTDRARDFYGDLFGWSAEDTGPDYGGYINFRSDDTAVAGCMANDGSSATPDGWTVYLAVDDARATTDRALANGAGVVVEPMDVGELGTMAMLIDAGGAAVGMWQPALHTGFGVLAEPGAPGWFELHTRDYAPTVEFYREVFGWDTHVASDTPDFRYTTLGEGEGQLAGIMDANGFLPDGVPAQWSIYFTVDDTDATLARIAELGGAQLTPATDTPYGRLATAADPTGAAFKLVSG